VFLTSMAIEDSMFLTFENWQLIIISQSINKNRITFEVLLEISGKKNLKQHILFYVPHKRNLLNDNHGTLFAFIVIKIQILLISLKFQILQDLGNVLIKFWSKNLFLNVPFIVVML
jgi:hypothetical protein